MFIEPNSHIKIYRGIETSSKKRPIFKTKAAQTAYFNAHLKYDYAPTTNVKYTNTRVRVSYPISQLLDCNYISFVNPNFGNKVYYANIVGDPVYINNDCTEITYAVDYCQTDMFDITIEDSYIEREHLAIGWQSYSLSRPYTAHIPELFTSEPLPVDKDLEKIYDFSDDDGKAFLALHKKWESIDRNDSMMYLVAFSPVTPPNQEAEDWFWDLCDRLRDDQVNSYYSFFQTTMNRVQIGGQIRSGYVYCSRALADVEGVEWDSQTGQTYLDIQSDFLRPYNIICTEEQSLIFGEDGILNNLTLWGAQTSIIGIHALPAYMVFEMFKSQNIDVNQLYVDLPSRTIAVGAEEYTIQNAKLLRFPFSYIRAISPAGDIKEYQYEKANMSEMVEQKFLFDVVMDYNNQPVVSLVPLNYKMIFPAPKVGSDKPNIFERLDLSAIPQVPYSTDAWLAGLAAANADILSQRTIDTQNALTHLANQNNLTRTDLQWGQGMVHGAQTLQDLMGAGATLVGVGTNPEGALLNGGGVTGVADSFFNIEKNFGSAVSRQINIDRQADNVAYSEALAKNQANRLNDSAHMSLSQLEANSVYQNFKDTKPMYACDNFVPSVGTGSFFFTHFNDYDFSIIVVQLRPSIIKKYDQWFENYGYNSGRFGVPRFFNYIQNSSDPNEIPYFGISGEYYVTYCKTNNVSVKAPTKTSEQFWEAMLNAGVQFIAGEEIGNTPVRPEPEIQEPEVVNPDDPESED